MLDLPAPFAAALARETVSLATCWRVQRRDGRVFRFTDHDADLAVGGETYLAAVGFKRSAFAADSSLAVDDVTLVGLIDHDALDEASLRAGSWDRAEVEAFVVDWSDPDAGRRVLRTGTLGEVSPGDDGVYTVELRGLTQALQQSVGEVYQPECRADVGDRRCKVPLLPPRVARGTAYAAGAWARPPAGPDGLTEQDGGRIWLCTAAGVTAAEAPAYGPAALADGTAGFEPREAWTKAGRVELVGSPFGLRVEAGWLDKPTAWFDGGVLVFETGACAGDDKALEVLSWNADTRDLALLTPMPFAVAPGDRFRVSPGCDRRRETCKAKFGNVVNYRGEPYLPGLDSLMAAAGST